MSNITIVKEETDARHGRYVARVEGIDDEAELTFTHRGPDKISADHTGAPDSLRGTGAAAALVVHMVEDARTGGFKIIPLCPYVAAQYAKHPEWSDVFVGYWVSLKSESCDRLARGFAPIRAKAYLVDMTNKPKRPRDANQLAKFIVDLTTGETSPEVVSDKVDASAKARGGRARAKSLNPEQRSEIASVAATARWKKRD